MKKILVLGDSFSQGSYAKWTGPPRPKWVAPDGPVTNRGWYYYVDYFKDKDVTVFACPCQGYWSFYQVLLFLEENNELDYDEIWIQETTEPRATIFDQKILGKIFSKQYNSTDNPLGNHTVVRDNLNLFVNHWQKDLSLAPWNPHIFHKKEEKLLPYTLWTDTFFYDIMMMATEKINLLCKEKNIKGYAWSMYEPIMDCNHFTRLPLKNVRQELYDNDLLTGKNHIGSHQTEEGNKYIAKLIDNACIDMKI